MSLAVVPSVPRTSARWNFGENSRLPCPPWVRGALLPAFAAGSCGGILAFQPACGTSRGSIPSASILPARDCDVLPSSLRPGEGTLRAAFHTVDCLQGKGVEGKGRRVTMGAGVECMLWFHCCILVVS
ncbi:hypothetical protein B0H13DRAFT_2335724 [Mycena leptocephala]|nr:hypothetical protein B0H13DRAFT_2335724 [Mycena leptocephala]